ncbi:MAG: LPXTG cell wall anchor domain-containing protein [Candidatus Woesebacteria bacterium]|jgi:LPXTG-motif cell wall-anchored protein
MYKKVLSFIFIFFTFFLCFRTVRAAGTLTLESIGGYLLGATTTEWYYTGTNPKFEGEAVANSEVQIKVDDTTTTVFADEAGDWIWTPSNLTTTADYNITISSDPETIPTFVLHLTVPTSSTSSATTSSSTTSTSSATISATPAAGKGGVTPSAELPQSGHFENTVILVAGGLLLIGFGIVSRVMMAEEVVLDE